MKEYGQDDIADLAGSAGSFEDGLHSRSVAPPPPATGDSGTLVAAAGGGDPEPVVVDEFVPVQADATGLTAAGQYRGVVVYRDGSGTIGTTVVLINR